MNPDFFWGVATAAFQIEGAASEDGRGESIWDAMCRRPGAIFTGENADVACDHYHRWREDIQWMRRLGVNAYRFSLAWPRIFPDGERINPAGLDFYRRLADGLRDAGIEPFVTLYHWDLPQALEARGGWAERATVDAFERYARAAVAALGDRVRYWLTVNEPWATAVYGYYQGVQAPGRREPPRVVAQVIHHLLLAHGRAVAAVRELGAPGARVGAALNPCCTYPATDSPVDRDAAEHLGRLENDWWLDPLQEGRYPEGGWRGLYDARPEIRPGDLACIAAPTDFLGVNYYTAHPVARDWDGFHGFRVETPGDKPMLGGLPFAPEGLGRLLETLHARRPDGRFLVTENGVCHRAETAGPGGVVDDDERVRYLRGHLEEVDRLRRAGLPLAGYFYWSLMDNFEWIWGYSSRFGLLRVEYDRGLRRIPKKSFHFYRRWIARHRREERTAPLPPPERISVLVRVFP